MVKNMFLKRVKDRNSHFSHIRLFVNLAESACSLTRVRPLFDANMAKTFYWQGF
jgi:hypothetical protein